MKKLKHFRRMIISWSDPNLVVRSTLSSEKGTGRDIKSRESKINNKIRVYDFGLYDGTYYSLGWVILKEEFRFFDCNKGLEYINWRNCDDLSSNPEFNTKMLASEAEWEAEQLERLIGKPVQSKAKGRL